MNSKRSDATVRDLSLASMEEGQMPLTQHQPSRFFLALMSKSSTEEGLTLLECLIALVVVGITATLILPPLFLATGTRVQNRRAEQAFNIAQEEINRLQTLVANEAHQQNRLPITATTNNNYFSMTTATNPIQNVDPPVGGRWSTKIRSQNATCANRYVAYNPSVPATAVDTVPINQALAVDIDNDCLPDFFMQVFRDHGTYADREAGGGVVATSRPTAFRAVVRVYSNVPNQVNSWSSMPIDAPVLPASLQFTSGQGNQRTRPLAVMTSLITWSSAPFASCGLQYQLARESGQTLPAAVTTRCRGDVAQIP